MGAIINASIRVDKLEAKKQRNYLGNGKVVWTNGQITIAEKEEVVQTATENDDLPF